MNVYFKAALDCVTLSMEIQCWISNIGRVLAFAVHMITRIDKDIVTHDVKEIVNP